MNLVSHIAAGGPGSGRKPDFGSPQAKRAAWLDKRQASIFGPKHVEEIQKNAKVKKVKAFGTAAGVTKAWDTRGRALSSLRSLHDSIKQETATHGYDSQYQVQRSQLNALVQHAKSIDPKSVALRMAQEHLVKADALAGKGDYRMATAWQDGALGAVHSWLRESQGTLQAAAAGWVGFDFDGTLAEEVKPFNPAKTGKPIPKMLDLLKEYLRQGATVKIFSARVGAAPVGREAIDKWCMKYVGRKLPITDKKDHLMTKLYDDKAVNPKDLSAYGTSEGVTKSWDIRGRSRARVGNLLKQGGWKTK